VVSCENADCTHFRSYGGFSALSEGGYSGGSGGQQSQRARGWFRSGYFSRSDRGTIRPVRPIDRLNLVGRAVRPHKVFQPDPAVVLSAAGRGAEGEGGKSSLVCRPATLAEERFVSKQCGRRSSNRSTGENEPLSSEIAEASVEWDGLGYRGAELKLPDVVVSSAVVLGCLREKADFAVSMEARVANPEGRRKLVDAYPEANAKRITAAGLQSDICRGP